MHITDGWIVVIIVVVACILLFSLGFYSIPYDYYEEEPEEKPRGRHRR